MINKIKQELDLLNELIGEAVDLNNEVLNLYEKLSYAMQERCMDELYNFQQNYILPYFKVDGYTPVTACLFGYFDSLEVLKNEKCSVGLLSAEYEGEQLSSGDLIDALETFICEMQELRDIII